MKIPSKIVITFLSAALAQIPMNARAAPAGLYGTASIVPGFGQALNGQVFEGLAWFIATAGLITRKSATATSVGFDLWQYNMYDAYRDAGGKPSANKNVFQNWASNVNPANIFDPIGAPIVGMAAVSGAPGGYPALRSPEKILMYSFVGLGEEGLFRGFIYPALSNSMNSRFLGAVTSSALFSAAHVTGGAAALQPVVFGIRFALGMFFCWELTRNNYDLSHNIFAHSWYDVLVDQDTKASIPRIALRWKASY